MKDVGGVAKRFKKKARHERRQTDDLRFRLLFFFFFFFAQYSVRDSFRLRITGIDEKVRNKDRDL